MKPLQQRASLLCLALLCADNAAALSIEFDYSFDNRGFFTDEATGEPLAERRALLELAASFYAPFTDQLTAISPAAGDHWSVNFVHPSLGGQPAVTISDEAIAADTIRVYVGGSVSSGGPGVLGFAGNGWGLTASGSDDFVDSVYSRGQANVSGNDASDTGPWGGYIWFNAANTWYFGEDESSLIPGHADFLTTATHEIGHILGYGGDAWYAQIENELFSGDASVALYGGPVPVEGPHWAEDTNSERNGEAQGTMMDPSTRRGTRELPTQLDYAGFKDIGWQVPASYVPLPAAGWLFLSASSILAILSRRRRTATA